MTGAEAARASQGAVPQPEAASSPGDEDSPARRSARRLATAEGEALNPTAEGSLPAATLAASPTSGTKASVPSGPTHTPRKRGRPPKRAIMPPKSGSGKRKRKDVDLPDASAAAEMTDLKSEDEPENQTGVELGMKPGLGAATSDAVASGAAGAPESSGLTASDPAPPVVAAEVHDLARRAHRALCTSGLTCSPL